MTIRKMPLDASLKRVETGPVQFGEDWPGTFIRGDDSFGYARALEMLIEAYESRSNDGGAVYGLNIGVVLGLLDLLRGCDLTARKPHAE